MLPQETLDALMAQATTLLRRAGTDSPHLCALALAEVATGLDRVGLVLAGTSAVPPETARHYAELVRRRAQGEPLAHILGRREFFGLDFAVTPQTLIPRPETELLVELALECMTLQEARLPQAALSFADWGTGSGCIGISLAVNRSRWKGLLLDIAPAALQVAGRNAWHHACHERLALVCADMARPPLPPASLDLMVSNPPYIADSEAGDVMTEVLRFEPHGALFSPENGLRHLQQVAAAARRHLKAGGWLLLEHGWKQGAHVRQLLLDAGLDSVITHRDLAGHERCTLGRLPLCGTRAAELD